MNQADMVRVCLSVVLVAAIGCQEKAATEATQTRREVDLKTPPPKQTTTKDQPPFHLLKLELLEPGAEPRRTIKYTFDGDFAMRAEAAVTLKDESAAVTVGLAITGTRSGRIGVVGLSADGTDAAAVANNKRIAGVRAAVDLAPNGTITRVGGSATLQQKRELTSLLLRHLAPLPSEAIGIGARWSVRYAIGRGGVFVAQTTTYELQAIVGATGAEELRLGVSTKESAEPQPIVSDGQMIGDLIALTSSASGTVFVGMSNPVIKRGSLALESTYHARASDAKEVYLDRTATAVLRSTVPKPAAKEPAD